MNIFIILIVIICLVEQCSAGDKKVKEEEKVSHSGVVTDMVPEGTVYYPKYELLPGINLGEEVSEILSFSCYKYSIGTTRRGRSIDEYRISAQSKLEGFEIENYVVTTCPYHTSDVLMQYTDVTKNDKGYLYKTVFQDENGKCYRRTYTTEYNDLTAKLSRGDPQPFTCTDAEVSKMGNIPKRYQDVKPETSEGTGIKTTELRIKRWSISGVFEKSITRNDFIKGGLKGWKMPGYCAEVSIKCRAHKTFSSNEEILVGDVFAPVLGAPLDRTVITSCEEIGLLSSYKCLKQECDAKHLEDTKSCDFTMLYQIPDGTCKERSYKVTLEFDEGAKAATRMSINRHDTKPVPCHWDMWNQANLYVMKKGIRSGATSFFTFLLGRSNKNKDKEKEKDKNNGSH